MDLFPLMLGWKPLKKFTLISFSLGWNGVFPPILDLFSYSMLEISSRGRFLKEDLYCNGKQIKAREARTTTAVGRREGDESTAGVAVGAPVP